LASIGPSSTAAASYQTSHHHHRQTMESPLVNASGAYWSQSAAVVVVVAVADRYCEMRPSGKWVVVVVAAVAVVGRNWIRRKRR
jgi:hypothetical protein